MPHFSPARWVRLIEPLEARIAPATFMVTNGADEGVGSLRQAIIDANAAAGADAIDFDYLGVIAVTASLPEILEKTYIKGYLGARPGNFTGIILDGRGAGAADGLVIAGAAAAGSQIEGITVTGFTGNGIEIRDTQGITITSCYIGSPASYTPNVESGILISNSRQITIGGRDLSSSGATPDAIGWGPGNVIAGNGSAGISIAGGSELLITGNFIGAEPSGTAVSNEVGISVTAAKVTIGGSETGAGNVISGNLKSGIHLLSGDGNVITGNHIGTDGSGMKSIPNGSGITVAGSAINTMVGGITPNLGNLISGNHTDGIYVSAGSGQTRIYANLIGTDAHGTSALPNGNSGITVKGTGFVQIGGGGTTRNVISGNGLPEYMGPDSAGIALIATAQARVYGNYVGTDKYGVNDLGNASHGIAIYGGNSVRIGGLNSSLGNVISGNGGYGIAVLDRLNDTGKFGTFHLVRGNSIGTDFTGEKAVGNEAGGIFLDHQAPNVTISGFDPGEGGPFFFPNVISGNHGPGIVANGTGHLIEYTHIGVNRAGTVALGNHADGIVVSGSSHTIRENIISGNGTVADGSEGFGIRGTGVGFDIRANKIGVDLSGTKALGNSAGGIALDDTSPPTPIPPKAYPYHRITANVVSGNIGDGMQLGVDSVITGNFIGTDPTGTKLVSNGGAGIVLEGEASFTIGGTGTSHPNVIGGNAQGGIIGQGGPELLLVKNWIGVNPGGQNIGNGEAGVHLSGNGVSLEARENFIGFNADDGIALTLGSVARGISISANWIGVMPKAPGSIAIGNRGDGIRVEGLGEITLPLLNISGNYLAANTGAAIILDDLAFPKPANSKPNTVIAGNFIGGVIHPNNANLAVMGDGIVLRDTFHAQVGGSQPQNQIAGMPTSNAAIRVDGGGYNVVSSNLVGFSYRRLLLPAGSIVVEGGHDHVIGGADRPNVLLGSGIQVFEGTGHHIADNRIFGGAIGVRMTNGVSHLVVENMVEQVTGDGMNLHGHGLYIERNRIDAVSGSGIVASGNQILVLQNIVQDTGTVGILLSDFTAGTVRANEVTYAGAAGLRFTSSTGDHSASAVENVISMSEGPGIEVLGGRVEISRNEFVRNEGLPVDLGGDGINENDPGDSDVGPNGFQNTFTQSSAVLRHGALIFSGSFYGAPDRALRVDVSYTLGAAAEHLGSLVFHTNSQGFARPIGNFAAIPEEAFVTVTVTDVTNRATSEMTFLSVTPHRELLAIGSSPGTKAVAKLVSASAPYETAIEVQPYGGAFRGGVRVARADVDGDGFDDLITAPHRNGHMIRVFSGFDGALLSEFAAAPRGYRGGIAIAAGDTDGDGNIEIVTARGAGTSPTVVIRDAHSGEIQSTFHAFGKTRRTGLNLSVGDLDGDGAVDIVASSRGGLALVRAFTGAGEPLSPLIRPFEQQVGAGAFTAVIPATPNSSGTIAIASGVGARGAVEYRELGGALRFTLPAFEGQLLTGALRIAAADVNGDGIAEIVAGCSKGSHGIVEVVSPSPSPDFRVFATSLETGIHLA